jgi:hypothetical protein
LDELSQSKEPKKDADVFGVFFSLALLEAREGDMLNLCRRAAELIEVGLTEAEEEELEKIKQRVKEMFGIEQAKGSA